MVISAPRGPRAASGGTHILQPEDHSESLLIANPAISQKKNFALAFGSCVPLIRASEQPVSREEAKPMEHEGKGGQAALDAGLSPEAAVAAAEAYRDEVFLTGDAPPGAFEAAEATLTNVQALLDAGKSPEEALAEAVPCLKAAIEDGYGPEAVSAAAQMAGKMTRCGMPFPEACAAAQAAALATKDGKPREEALKLGWDTGLQALKALQNDPSFHRREKVHHAAEMAKQSLKTVVFKSSNLQFMEAYDRVAVLADKAVRQVIAERLTAYEHCCSRCGCTPPETILHDKKVAAAAAKLIAQVREWMCQVRNDFQIRVDKAFTPQPEWRGRALDGQTGAAQSDERERFCDDMFEQLITPDMFDNLETYFAVELTKLLKELKLAEDVEAAHLGTSSKDIVQKMKLQVEALYNKGAGQLDSQFWVDAGADEQLQSIMDIFRHAIDDGVNVIIDDVREKDPFKAEALATGA